MNFTEKEGKYLTLMSVALLILLISAFMPERDFALGFGLDIVPYAFKLSMWFRYIVRIIYNLIFWTNLFLFTVSIIKKNI